MNRRTALLCVVSALCTAAACGGGTAPDGGGTDAGATDSGSGPHDAGPPHDSGPLPDLGPRPDLGPTPNLCTGLVHDLDAHPMTALAKPALGATVVDPEFGTTIRRISETTATALRPMYSTISAWNADESLLILYEVDGAGHVLYDGHTYARIRTLDIAPPDLEQVFWDTRDPDLLYFVRDRDFIRYHVGSDTQEVLTTFSFCTSGPSSGPDPMYISWDGARVGLGCDGVSFLYDIATNVVLGMRTAPGVPQAAPSGTLAYIDETGDVVAADSGLTVLRTLDLAEPFGHASLGRLPSGHDTWNGAAYDPGPGGSPDIGNLVVFDLTDGSSRTIIGPSTGYPYPPSGHVSSMAYTRPGWVVVSTFGNTDGSGLLDLEVLIANTADGTVCRAGRHRSWGKDNTVLAEPYWAEAHAVPSPSGTRILFASDWGNGATVDAYVLELPAWPG